MTKSILLVWLGKILKAFLEDLPIDWEKPRLNTPNLCKPLRNWAQIFEMSK
jgi:hypothetical protein